MTTHKISNVRIESIDLLRGIVMIIMALDHVRSYLHFDSLIFNPSDLKHTSVPLFLTRLITHLCAPAFIFLAGTSAYFISQRKTIGETSLFLVTRGIWLIILQFTLIRFVWNFDPGFHYNSSTIISTIGFCMVGLSLLIYLRLRIILIIGIAMVAGHNLLDHLLFDNGTAVDVFWSFLHVKKLYTIGNDYTFMFLYPIIPWVGVMALGYCMGRLYDHDYSLDERKKSMLLIGVAGISIFFVLRWINGYGDPLPWSPGMNATTAAMSFFNVEKYPPSLLFLCLTLGIALVMLSILEGRDLRKWASVILFGKVSLFYYVLHIFVIHLVALLAVIIAGYPWHTMIFIESNHPSPLLTGKFGFSLGVTYVIWMVIVTFLYPFCKSWYSFKIKNKTKWWVSYV